MGVVAPRVTIGVSNLKIKNNHIHDNVNHGIWLFDVTDSVVSNNHVWNNGDNGISLVTEADGATYNQISSNTAFGNGNVDLFHDVSQHPQHLVGQQLGYMLGQSTSPVVHNLDLN